MNSVPAVRREVLVNAGPEDAFRVFTERINSWWPLAVHFVHGVGGTVTFAAADGSTLVTLVHDRWEALAQPRVAREEYNDGWVGVLEQFVAAIPEAA